MNWETVRSRNTRQSAKKARRDRNAAELKARIERAGGPIGVAEIRDAARRVERAAPGHVHERHVWTFRGRDWVLGYSDGDLFQVFSPFVPWRQDPDYGAGVPMTAGAKKWVTALIQSESGFRAGYDD